MRTSTKIGVFCLIIYRMYIFFKFVTYPLQHFYILTVLKNQLDNQCQFVDARYRSQIDNNYNINMYYYQAVSEEFIEDDEQPELPSNFFMNMLKAEKSYQENCDEENTRALLCYYTDCVNYFDFKQESISEYFQSKIKEIVREIQKFGVNVAERNKERLTKNVMKEMQEKNIHETINAELKKQKKMNDKVSSILRLQQEKLEKRIQSSKRSMSKSQSFTYSFGSINSSPDIRDREKKQILGLKSSFLFKKEIDSSDQEKTTE